VFGIRGVETIAQQKLCVNWSMVCSDFKFMGNQFCQRNFFFNSRTTFQSATANVGSQLYVNNASLRFKFNLELNNLVEPPVLAL
jgi:hypothetical protein